MSLFRRCFGWSGFLLSSAAVLTLACDAENAENALEIDTSSNALATSREVPAVDNLRQELPAARLKMRNGRVKFISGNALASADTPEQSAERFRALAARAFMEKTGDLAPQRVVLNGRKVVSKPEPVGLMYDRKTETFKFWLYRYGQQVGKIPVHDAELLVLVRNKPGYPVVSAVSSLRNIGGFVPSAAPRALKINRDLSIEAARADVSRKAQRARPSGLAAYSEPELVLFAGAGEKDVPPRLAIRYTGEEAGGFGLWRFIADAETGEVLTTEDQVHSTNVWGRVVGNVTVQPVAADCAPEVLMPLPHAEVSIPGVLDGFTGQQGYYSLSNPGTAPVQVASTLFGRYFDVLNYVGDEEVLTSTVTPPGPAFFVHNQSNNAEYVIAQSNAYYHANLIRSLLLHYSPDYPMISTQTNFHIDVNGDETYWGGGTCPAGAWYKGTPDGQGYIVFCKSGSKEWGGEAWTNTAYGSIIYHEYTHHIHSSGGGGQNEYAEGFADSVAVLIAGDPGYGRGYLLGDCSSIMRNADNDCQYDPVTCTTDPDACGDYDDIYGCGKLLSGIMWDLREALRASHPTDFQDILFPLVFDQAQYYSGSTSINGDILMSMLTLDDDDDDLDNGTPHSAELCSAFEAHGIDCPISGTRPCDGICSNPVVFNWSGSYQSGQLQTGAVCRETTQNVAGGNCGNLVAPRSLSVNGTVMTCNNQNWSNVPPKRNGGYCVSTTPGSHPYAFFTLW